MKAPYTLQEDCTHCLPQLCTQFQGVLGPQVESHSSRSPSSLPRWRNRGSESGSAFQQVRREVGLLIPHQVLALPYSALC